MVADKTQVLKQLAVIYGSLLIPALVMTLATGDPLHLVVMPVLFGSVVACLQGLFDPTLWRESNDVSTQRGAVR